MAVEAGTRIGDSLQGSLRQHSLDLLTQGKSFWRVEGYVGNGTGALASVCVCGGGGGADVGTGYGIRP